MDDVVWNYITVWAPDKHRAELLEALNRERAEHEKQVADLRKRIFNLEAQLQDER